VRQPYQIRPLGPWAGPVTGDRKSSGVFRASWDDTLARLRDEVALLDGEYPIVIQVDADETDIRADGMLRARASVGFPGVAVSFQSRFGPLRYATDAYEQRYGAALPGWQANVRAIALALEDLRAVDRYGVSRRGEQYTGWKALPAGDGTAFGSADHALAWMRARYGAERGDPAAAADLAAGELYRRLARILHPDAGGDPADWDRLDAARPLLVTGGLL